MTLSSIPCFRVQFFYILNLAIIILLPYVLSPLSYIHVFLCNEMKVNVRKITLFISLLNFEIVEYLSILKTRDQITCSY